MSASAEVSLPRKVVVFMKLNTFKDALQVIRLLGPKAFEFVVLVSSGASLLMGSIGTSLYISIVRYEYSFERIFRTYQIILIQCFLVFGGLTLAYLFVAAMFYRQNKDSGAL